MSHDRLDINPGDTVEVDFGPGKPKIHFVVKTAHNYLDHKDADDSWIMETSEGYTWQQEVDGGTVRILRKAGAPVLPAGKKFHRQGDAVAAPKAPKLGPWPAKPADLDDLPPAPPQAALQRRFDVLSNRMMALGEGDLLLTAYLDECLDFSHALVRFAAAGIDRPISSYAPELLALVVKYEDLLSRSAEPVHGAHDGFGNR